MAKTERPQGITEFLDQSEQEIASVEAGLSPTFTRSDDHLTDAERASGLNIMRIRDANLKTEVSSVLAAGAKLAVHSPGRVAAIMSAADIARMQRSLARLTDWTARVQAAHEAAADDSDPMTGARVISASSTATTATQT